MEYSESRLTYPPLTRRVQSDHQSITHSNTVPCPQRDVVAPAAVKTSDGGVGIGHNNLVGGTVKLNHSQCIVINFHSRSTSVSGAGPVKRETIVFVCITFKR